MCTLSSGDELYQGEATEEQGQNETENEEEKGDIIALLFKKTPAVFNEKGAIIQFRCGGRGINVKF